VEVPGETRQNLTLLDESTGIYTKINEPGPTIGPRQVAALRALVTELAVAGDLWAFCGSLPPGAPLDLYAELIHLVQARGARAILDSSGEALSLGLAACPFGLKPNSEEAAEALGRPVITDEEHAAAARRLQALGVTLVCLTRGAHGLLLAHESGKLVTATPPPVAARSPVGAGDATLAGLLWAISENCDVVETARRAVACGTATAMQEGTGVGTRSQVEELLPQISVSRLVG
jgi:1-phosphofructokinase family hexose kinase